MEFRAVKLGLARALAHEGLYIRTCPESSRGYCDLGRHYVVDEKNNICAKRISIQAWARAARVIGPEVHVEDE